MQAFSDGKFCDLRILRKRACLKSAKRRQIGDRFTAISDLQNNEERVLFQAGNRQLSQKFPKTVYGPQVPKNLKFIELFFKGIQRKSNSSRTAHRKAGVSLSLETRISLVSRDYKRSQTFD